MNTLKNEKKNIILIDTSYTLFHRYFATLRWLSLAHTDIYKQYINDKDYNWLENSIFIEKYEKLYLDGIIKLVGKKIYKDSIVIFCMDTPREQLWRTIINTDYKGERYDMTKKTNFVPTFKYTYDLIITDLLKNDNIYKIKVAPLEADDVIAIICKNLENSLNINIYIVSGDKDFYQLGRPNIFFIDFKNKELKNLSNEESRILLHKKILLGDKSDNIKTIFPSKFSLKLKKKLLNSIEEFSTFIVLNKDIEVRYNENSHLINFDFIPLEYIKPVIDELYKLFI